MGKNISLKFIQLQLLKSNNNKQNYKNNNKGFMMRNIIWEKELDGKTAQIYSSYLMLLLRIRQHNHYFIPPLVVPKTQTSSYK